MRIARIWGRIYETTGWWALLPVALFVAAAAWASITTDYDHNVNFINFKTYSWGKLETGNSIWDEPTKSAVDSALAAKGWTQVQSGGDVLVNAFGKTHPEYTMNTFYDGFEGGWRWRGFGGVGEATTNNRHLQSRDLGRRYVRP